MDEGKAGPLHTKGWNVTSKPTLESSLDISLKIEIDLSYDPAIQFLGLHSEGFLSYYRNTYIIIFINAVFTTIRKWIPPRCPSSDK